MDLGKKQKKMLESILEEGGSWLFRIGYDLDVMDKIRWIIEEEKYDSFDRELLNEIRECWLDRVGMRI